MYNNAQAKDYVDALLTRAARPMCALFQIMGHNRARQRDKWAHMLDDLSNLQEEVIVLLRLTKVWQNMLQHNSLDHLIKINKRLSKTHLSILTLPTRKQ